MKKSLLVLTAALTFGMAAAQTTATSSAPQVPTLTDVPAGHWAKDAIDKLVSKGIILGYPDGTYRGTQNLTRYEAAVIIARLLDQMVVTGTTTTVGGNPIDADTLASLQNAIQELAADLAALGVRVTDLEENAVSRDDFNNLEDRVNTLAASTGDADALANIQAQLDDLTARADDYDTLRADVDDNASSIAALNDLTVLLNQDILNLQDRVSAVEAAQADFVQRKDFDALSGKVGAVDTRVTKLETAPKFGVSGELSVAYGRIALTQGTTNFDVDRLVRQTFIGDAFSTGVNCNTNFYAGSGNAVSCVDTNNNTYTGGVSFGVKASNLTTTNGKIVVNNAAINFYTNNAWTAGSDVTVNVDNASADGTFNGQKFDVKYANGNSQFKFNDYLFANDSDSEGAVTRRGAVINIQATQLPLAPKLTIVAGNAKGSTSYLDGNSATPPAGSGAVPGFAGNYYGLRASVNPNADSTFGVAFAQNDANRSALGADWDAKFGPVGLTGAAVISVPITTNNFIAGSGTLQNAWNNGNKAFYTDLNADLGAFKVAGNFRGIDPTFADGVAGMSANDAPYYYGTQGYKSSMPYGPNQVGFGAGFGTTLGPIAVGAFGDSYVPWAGGARNTSFGIGAGLKFGAFSAKGFYNRAMLDNTTISTDLNYQGPGASGFSYNLTSPYMDVADVPMAWSSSFGGLISHDGKADNALIKGLSFTVADTYFYGLTAAINNGNNTTSTYTAYANDLQAYANYSGTFGGVKIEPFIRYHLFKTPNVSDVTTAVAGDDVVDGGNGTSAKTYNTLKYGVKLSTAALTGVPLQPSLYANFANRVTSFGTSVKTNTPNAEELFFQGGITLNQFLVPNLKASVGYSYYQAFGVGSLTTGSSASGASATYSAAADRIYRSPFSGADTPFNGDNFGTANGKLDGIYAQADWNGLAANYGIFRYTDLNSNAQSIAQAFKVSYTFKF